MDAFKSLHEELGDRGLLGNPGRMPGDRQEHVTVDDDGLVFYKHAVRMVFIRIQSVDTYPVGLQSVNVMLLLLPGQINIGWTGPKESSECVGVRRRNTANQCSLLLVQPHGGHGITPRAGVL